MPLSLPAAGWSSAAQPRGARPAPVPALGSVPGPLRPRAPPRSRPRARPGVLGLHPRPAASLTRLFISDPSGNAEDALPLPSFRLFTHASLCGNYTLSA